MADQKLSAMTTATPVTGDELVYVVQGGTSKKTTVDDIIPDAISAFTNDAGYLTEVTWGTIGGDIQEQSDLIDLLGTNAIPHNTIISGNAIWRSGLIYDVTAAVYYINGVRYTSAPGFVTLNAADATNPRIDVIYLDSTGNFGVLTGTPGVNPIKPSIDPATQIELTLALVEAGATTPTGVTNEIIYKENTEWTTSGTANFDDTSNPYEGAKDAAVATFTTSQSLIFTDSVKNNFADFTSLSFRIRLSATWSKTTWLTVIFSDGSTPALLVAIRDGQHGFSRTLAGAYQLISIDLNSLPQDLPQFDKLTISTNGGGAAFLIDDVFLQSNQQQPPPPAQIMWNQVGGKPFIVETATTTITVPAGHLLDKIILVSASDFAPEISAGATVIVPEAPELQKVWVINDLSVYHPTLPTTVTITAPIDAVVKIVKIIV